MGLKSWLKSKVRPGLSKAWNYTKDKASKSWDWAKTHPYELAGGISRIAGATASAFTGNPNIYRFVDEGIRKVSNVANNSGSETLKNISSKLQKGYSFNGAINSSTVGSKVSNPSSTVNVAYPRLARTRATNTTVEEPRPGFSRMKKSYKPTTLNGL